VAEQGEARGVFRYAEGGAARIGWVRGDGRFAPLPADSLGGFLGLDERARREAIAAAMAGQGRPLGEVEMLALVDDGAAVWALALNYDSHVSEGAHQRPDHPMLFLRLAESFAAHGGALMKPRATQQFDYEGELAVYVGCGGADIVREAAMAHVGGYACCNEGSVREWQRHTSQITPGKNFWRSGALGPAVRPAGDGYDPYGARLATRINGVQEQGALVGEMLFRIDEVIAYVSTVTRLRAGDVILMGTPGGVGFRRKPQLFLDPGDTVEVEIDGLGVLVNTVEAR
jgi:2-keto-4-pentenoate hydratase/2-oxohepta-3-ene-1,7-dioic acid hydratase in catechol pathway